MSDNINHLKNKHPYLDDHFNALNTIYHVIFSYKFLCHSSIIIDELKTLLETNDTFWFRRNQINKYIYNMDNYLHSLVSDFFKTPIDKILEPYQQRLLQKFNNLSRIMRRNHPNYNYDAIFIIYKKIANNFIIYYLASFVSIINILIDNHINISNVTAFWIYQYITKWIIRKKIDLNNMNKDDLKTSSHYSLRQLYENMPLNEDTIKFYTIMCDISVFYRKVNLEQINISEAGYHLDYFKRLTYNVRYNNFYRYFYFYKILGFGQEIINENTIKMPIGVQVNENLVIEI